MGKSNILLALHRWTDARQVGERAVAEAEHSGVERMLGGYLGTLAQILLAQGEVTASLAVLRRVLELEGARDDASLMRDARCHLALAQLASGAADAAQREIESLDASRDPKTIIEQNLVGGWSALACGDVRAARKRAQDVRAHRSEWVRAVLQRGRAVGRCHQKTTPAVYV